jgi:type IV pilus assembly protein PilC
VIDYVYTAKNLDTGEIVRAGVKADSPQSAARLLAKQQLFPLEITAKSESDILARLGIHGRISTKERVLFTRQLATLINAGLPLSRALHTVQEQINSQAFRDIIGSVVAAVEGGSSLADAFNQHPKVFNEIYISLVSAGEASGTLDKALQRLALQQEKDAAIAGKIRGAMIYPVIVLVLVVGVIILMLTSVVPQVSTLYKDLGKDLPIMTKVLVAVSNYLVHYWWTLILLVVAAGFGLRALWQREDVKLAADRLKIRIPLFGKLFEKVYMARFSRTLNTLLGSGVPMISALGTVRNAVGNRVVASDLDEATKEVRGGKSLSQALETKHSFLLLVPQMAKIGEESGTMDDMLGRTATYYEDEVDEAVKNLSTTLEPIMMVVLGGIVALVLFAVLGPIYSLVGSGDLSNPTGTNSSTSAPK